MQTVSDLCYPAKILTYVVTVQLCVSFFIVIFSFDVVSYTSIMKRSKSNFYTVRLRPHTSIKFKLFV